MRQTSHMIFYHFSHYFMRYRWRVATISSSKEFDIFYLTIIVIIIIVIMLFHFLEEFIKVVMEMVFDQITQCNNHNNYIIHLQPANTKQPQKNKTKQNTQKLSPFHSPPTYLSPTSKIPITPIPSFSIIYISIQLFLILPVNTNQNDHLPPQSISKMQPLSSINPPENTENNIDKYLLKDYAFLHDYIVVENKSDNSPIKQLQKKNQQQFIAQIMGTQQVVRFTKIPYDQLLMPRFQALAELHEQGILLADNLFILQQTGLLYFYIIQAFIPDEYTTTSSIPTKFQSTPIKTPLKQKNQNLHNISDLSSIAQQQQISRFTNLHHYINNPHYPNKSIQHKIKMIDKIKILLECIHQTGQTYIGLTPYQIIIDLEQEQNIYFAPFALNPHIFTNDRQISSYMSPEMLEMQMEMVNSEEIKVSREMMIKNDIWAFGCILLEILFYSSPAFYAIANCNQLKIIKQFMISGGSHAGKLVHMNTNQQSNIQSCIKCLNEGTHPEHIQTKLKLITNLIYNTLQLNHQHRILSCQQVQFQKLSLICKQLIPNHQNQIININQNKSNGKYIDEDTSNLGNSQLILQFLYISKINFCKQLRINIYLDKRYSFFISSSSSSSSPTPNQNLPHPLNKTLKLSYNFQFLQKMLETPILCQLCVDDSLIKIHINLSILVLTIDGKRVWDKAVVGSYSSLGKIYRQSRDEEIVIKIKSEVVWKIQEECMRQRIRRYELENLEKVKDNQLKTLKQQKQNQQPKQTSKQLKTTNKQSTTTQYPTYKNYFDSINSNLQQLCNKWKNNDIIKFHQSNQIINNILTKDQEITNKIKQIINKFNIGEL